MTLRSFSKTCYFSYFQPSGITQTNQNLWHVVDTNHADGKLLRLQQYGLNNGKPFTHNFSSLVSTRSLTKTDKWAIIAGNTEWGDSQVLYLVENKKVGRISYVGTILF